MSPGRRPLAVRPWMRPWMRAALVGLIALGLTPGTWWRTPLPEGRVQRLSITALAFAAPAPRDWPRGLAVDGLWALASPDPFFGGYSALLRLGEGRLRAFSDKGDSLTFTEPGQFETGPPAPRFATVAPDAAHSLYFQDIEALATDPATGRYWLSYEAMNAIRRFGPVGSDAPAVLVRPPQMRRWPGNSGGEAMVRLADGRFIVFGERSGRGLLFAEDPVAGGPVAGARATEFAIAWPAGYRPADAASLPDGRVLVLMRAVRRGWPVFSSLLVIGDPRRIGRREVWRPEPFAVLDGALPAENYEALAIQSDTDSVALWLMSDDNFAAFQRTLLVRLRWRP